MVQTMVHDDDADDDADDDVDADGAAADDDVDDEGLRWSVGHTALPTARTVFLLRIIGSFHKLL